MEVVIFKDLLEDDSEPQYGLLEDRDEPSVICLECGGEIEFGDYEILERLPWRDFSKMLEKKQKFVVCMDETYVRDSQMLDTSGLSNEEFQKFDFTSCENEHRWHDMEPNPFIAIVEAASEDEACQKAAEQKRYDKRCLFAIKI